MVVFTRKFGTLDPHLPIVWDRVPKKTVFFDTFPKRVKDFNSGWAIYIINAMFGFI